MTDKPNPLHVTLLRTIEFYASIHPHLFKIVNGNSITFNEINEMHHEAVWLRLDAACKRCENLGFLYCMKRGDLFKRRTCLNRCCLGCYDNREEHLAANVDLLLYQHDRTYTVAGLFPLCIGRLPKTFEYGIPTNVLLSRRIVEFATIYVAAAYTHGWKKFSRHEWRFLLWSVVGVVFDDVIVPSRMETSLVWNTAREADECECKVITTYAANGFISFHQSLRRCDERLVDYWDSQARMGTRSCIYVTPGRSLFAMALSFKNSIEQARQYQFHRGYTRVYGSIITAPNGGNLRQCQECFLQERSYMEMEALYPTAEEREDGEEVETCLSLLEPIRNNLREEFEHSRQRYGPRQTSLVSNEQYATGASDF